MPGPWGHSGSTETERVARSLASHKPLRSQGWGLRVFLWTPEPSRPSSPVLGCGSRPRAGGTGSSWRSTPQVKGRPSRNSRLTLWGWLQVFLRSLGDREMAEVKSQRSSSPVAWAGGVRGAQPVGPDPPSAPLGCERDRLSFGFCETLRLLGRCQLPTVRAQCCRSCPPPGVPSRGHQRVARR